MRASYQQAQKTTGRVHRRLLEVPEMPEELRYLFEWWKWEVAGAEPLTYERLATWSQVTRKDLLGWEAETLMKLDMIYRYVRNGAPP